MGRRLWLISLVLVCVVASASVLYATYSTYHKPIYISEFGFSGQPDLATLYNVQDLHGINRTTYAGWTDATSTPPGSWCDLLVADATSKGWTLLMIDHEDWDVSTQAARLATAAKIVTTYNCVKTRMPTLSIGFYGAQFTPVRDVSSTCRCLLAHNAANYLAWQAENNDFAAVYASVDILMPSLYFFETRAVDGVAAVSTFHTFFTENLTELKRLRTAYGHNQPIYPWVWARRHDDATELDLDVWEDQMRTAYQQGDGVLIFALFNAAWSDTANWWTSTRLQLLSPYPWGERTRTQSRTSAAARNNVTTPRSTITTPRTAHQGNP